MKKSLFLNRYEFLGNFIRFKHDHAVSFYFQLHRRRPQARGSKGGEKIKNKHDFDHKTDVFVKEMLIFPLEILVFLKTDDAL